MKNYVRVSSFALIMASAVGGNAQAYDGNITFKGAVTASTCTIDGNGSGGKDFTVELGEVQASALKNGDKRANTTNFFIEVGGNAECTETAARVRFERHSPQIDPETGYLKNAAVGGADNVSVVIMDKLMADIRLNEPGGALSPEEPLAPGKKAKFDFYAAMVGPKTGEPKTGEVMTNVYYSINYN